MKKLVDAFMNMVAKENKEAKPLDNLQARIMVRTLSYNNSAVMVDENGESHTPPAPDVSGEEYVMKKGNRVGDFEVTELTTNFIVLKSLVEYIEDNASAPATQFVVEKGACIHLRLCGVYDAVHKTSVEYLETVEKM